MARAKPQARFGLKRLNFNPKRRKDGFTLEEWLEAVAVLVLVVPLFYMAFAEYLRKLGTGASAGVEEVLDESWKSDKCCRERVG